MELKYDYGTAVITVKIKGSNVTFVNSTYGAIEATIEGLKLSRAGVVKEFPDLKDSMNWREEAIKRFKTKISTLQTEDAIAEYINLDLKKFGYVPKWKQKQGFRREKLL